MAQVNQKIGTQGTKFTRFIQDGENNGSATARYDVWHAAIKQYMPDLPDIRIGQAFSSSTNTVSLSQKFPKIKSSMMALPETYWYNDLMKDGFGKFDSKNKDMQLMLEALMAGGLDESKAKELIIYGVGCEGCDHNHLGAARQATKVSDLLDIASSNNVSENSLYHFPGSGWPFGIGTPTSGTCGLPNKCMIQDCLQCSSDGKYCQMCNKGTMDMSGKGFGPCATPHSDFCSSTDQCKSKGCKPGFECDSSSQCCLSTGIAPTTSSPADSCDESDFSINKKSVTCAYFDPKKYKTKSQNGDQTCLDRIKAVGKTKAACSIDNGWTGYCKDNNTCQFKKY